MIVTRSKEEAIGWTNIPKKKTPIGTNYPPMRARGAKVESRIVLNPMTPITPVKTEGVIARFMNWILK